MSLSATDDEMARYHVTGMDCASCAAKIEKAAKCRFMFETGTRAVSKLNGLHETEM